MDRVVLIWIAITVVVFLIVFFLDKLKRKIYKYIPSIMLLLLAISAVIKAKYFSENTGFEGLGYIVLFVIAIVPAIASFVLAIVLDARKNDKK